MGRPKALVEGWLARALASLADCDDVVVVLGAQAEAARALLPDGTEVVVAADWAEGMGASLRAGLRHLAGGGSTRCVVTLVDLPDVDARVVARLRAVPDGPTVLARAAYAGTPGHPVLLGRDHWAGVADAAGRRPGGPRPTCGPGRCCSWSAGTSPRDATRTRPRGRSRDSAGLPDPDGALGGGRGRPPCRPG